MRSYVIQHDLEPEDQEELGLREKSYKNAKLNNEAIEWIETAAYHIWLNEGCPDGLHLSHWEKAYRLFRDTR